MIQLNRAYDRLARLDGMGVLVERLWPSGLKKKTGMVGEGRRAEQRAAQMVRPRARAVAGIPETPPGCVARQERPCL